MGLTRTSPMVVSRMANPEHLEILDRGVRAWNQWRSGNRNTRPDLSDVELSGRDLSDINPSRAALMHARLRSTSLRSAHLDHTDLSHADLFETDLTDADLSQSVLQHARLNGATITGATFWRCRIHGLSTWGVHGKPARQDSLYVTPMSNYVFPDVGWRPPPFPDRPDPSSTYLDFKNHAAGMSIEAREITREEGEALSVDDLQVGYLIYLMLENPKFRDIIDTVTAKVVLIPGRFAPPRMDVLQSLRLELQGYDYVPVVFDFDQPSNQDISDTVTLLARIARFVIADLTDPMSVQQELTLIALQVMVAIQPIIQTGQKPWAMFDDLRRRSHGLLPAHEYHGLDDLLDGLEADVIEPAEARRKHLLPVIAAEAT